MEAGRLTRAGAGACAPWLVPFRDWFGPTDPRASGRLDLARLNALAQARALRLETGRALRFAAAPARATRPYEIAIAESGCVPTRTQGAGMVHDWLNALCWLRWPATKARLNRLHVDALLQGGRTALDGARGPVRDRATLFDESGALLVTRDAGQLRHWRRLDWQRLFVEDRARFARDTAVLVVGHALLEKLLVPYKAICAQALGMLQASERPDPSASRTSLDALDRALADRLDADTLARDRFTPLPVLGIPGWWPANEEPWFYDDPRVFRAARRDR